MQGFSKYKDGIKYLLSVIDVFSKYLHVVPLKSKTGPSVTRLSNRFLKTLDSLNLYGGAYMGADR